MYALPAIYKKFLLHFSFQGKCQNLPKIYAYCFTKIRNTFMLFLFLHAAQSLLLHAYLFHCYLVGLQHVTETPTLHRYRHIGMPYVQAFT
jgi:hypothetical protein